MLALSDLDVLAIAGAIAALLAALLHLVIFYMESIDWEGSLARSTFGGTPEEARPHAFYAYNQGFYNLFLALEVLLGLVLAVVGHGAVAWSGIALTLYGTGSMLAAAVVLALRSAEHRLAAVKQGAFPGLALVCLVISLLA